jgi:ribosomal protein L40E
MLCPRCGFQASTGARFCGKCGNNLLVCSKCGSPVPNGANFCGTCGSERIQTGQRFPPRIERSQLKLERVAKIIGAIAVLGFISLLVAVAVLPPPESQKTQNKQQPREPKHDSSADTLGEKGQESAVDEPVQARIKVGDRVSVNLAPTGTLPVARTLDVAKEIWLSDSATNDEFRAKTLLLLVRHEIFFFEPSTPAVVIEVDIDSATPKFPSGRFAKVRTDVPKRPGEDEGWVTVTTLRRLDKDGALPESAKTTQESRQESKQEPRHDSVVDTASPSPGEIGYLYQGTTSPHST